MRVHQAIFLRPSSDGSESEKFGSPAPFKLIFQRRLFRFLWLRLKPYRGTISLAATVSLITAGLAIVPPWAFKQASDRLNPIVSWQPIIFWTGVGLVATSLFSVIQSFGGYLLSLIQARLSLELRNELFQSVQSQPLDFHLRRRTGELASLIGNDTEAASSGFVVLFDGLLRNPLNLLALSVVMFYFNPWLSLTALLSLPLLNLLVNKLGKKALEAERHFLNSQGNLLGAIMESLTNVKQVKSLGLEQDRQNRITALGQKAIQWRLQALINQLWVGPAAEATNILALLGMAVVAYYQISRGLSSTGQVVGCLTAALALKGVVRRLAESFLMLQRSAAAVQRLEWVLCQPSNSVGRQVLPGPILRIALVGLSFSYDGHRQVLSDVTFKVEQGERVAVWGPSGSGKTTLLDLITGLYPATRGQIRINDSEITEIDLNSFRQQIGVVTQEPFLFDGTIEENIAFGYSQVDESKICYAAELAGLKKTLSRLSQGLQTPVGERGARLSGGERKRVALARALIRPISVLILDEATSELDAQMEEEILSTLDSLSDSLIIFIISHRKSILNHCDKIIKLSHGRVTLESAGVQ